MRKIFFIIAFMVVATGALAQSPLSPGVTLPPPPDDLQSMSPGLTWNVYAKLTIPNPMPPLSVAYDPASAPLITIFDQNLNVVVSSFPMSRITTGAYAYPFVEPSNTQVGTIVGVCALSGQKWKSSGSLTIPLVRANYLNKGVSD